jgi:hypothetical protein
LGAFVDVVDTWHHAGIMIAAAAKHGQGRAGLESILLAFLHRIHSPFLHPGALLLANAHGRLICF